MATGRWLPQGLPGPQADLREYKFQVCLIQWDKLPNEHDQTNLSVPSIQPTLSTKPRVLLHDLLWLFQMHLELSWKL